MVDWRRLGGLLRPDRTADEAVDEELRFHIEGRIEELVASGWNPEEARVEVLKRFGDYAAVEEACRRISRQRIEREGWRMRMEMMMRDVRHALRGMRRNPGFTGVVVLTLALGIGATTAIFTVVNGVLLKPLPYEDADRLTMVWQNDRATGTTREPAGSADFYDFLDRAQSFSALTMFRNDQAAWTRAEGEPRRLASAAAWHDLLSTLGRDTRLGRGFTEEDTRPGAPPVVLIGDRLWRTELGGDPGVLGTTLTLDDIPHEVVGVLPVDLDFPTADVEIWRPLRMSRALATRSPHSYRVVGRLAPGVTASRAHTEMVALAAQMEEEDAQNTNRGAFVEPLSEYLRGDVRTTLWVLLGAVFGVLLIACGNVANLLLARGTARARETAVHAALGAGFGRMARKYAAEGAIVTLAAATLGSVVAVLGTRALMRLAPVELRRLEDVSVDPGVLGFTLLLTVLIGIGFGLVPTLQWRCEELGVRLREGDGRSGGPSRMGVRRTLVAGQLAMAVVLLVSSGLLIGTLVNLQRVDPGFRSDGVLRMSTQLPASRYPRDFSVYPNWPEIQGFMQEALVRAEALPGVTAAALAIDHPLSEGFTNSFGIEGRPWNPDWGEMSTRLVTGGYLETAGLRLVEGRFIETSDGPGEPRVLVLNRTAAERFFPDGDAIGSRITFWGRDNWREIVGIVEDERIHGLIEDVPPAMYAEFRQSPPRGGPFTIMIRTAGAPDDYVRGLREAIWAIDRDLPLFDVATMEETLRDATARERFASTMLVVFSGVALFLSVLGVHGVLACQVAQRQREVGVRIALGASGANVTSMIVRQGMAMAGLGLGLGLGMALASTRLLEGLLFGISPTNPTTYAVVALALGTAALAGCAVPARRATRVDPMTSIRGD